MKTVTTREVANRIRESIIAHESRQIDKAELTNKLMQIIADHPQELFIYDDYRTTTKQVLGSRIAVLDNVVKSLDAHV